MHLNNMYWSGYYSQFPDEFPQVCYFEQEPKRHKVVHVDNPPIARAGTYNKVEVPRRRCQVGGADYVAIDKGTKDGKAQ